MSRRGENIYKRKDGRYEGRYITGKTLQGNTRFGYVYARSYADVRAKLLKKKVLFLAEDKMQRIYGRGLYEDWAVYWLENCIRSNVRASTYSSYKNILRHLLIGLGKQPIRTLNGAALQTFLNGLAAQGLARSTREGIVRMLKSSLQAALDEGLIDQNPSKKLRLEKNTRGEQRVLNREEQKHLVAEADAQDQLAVLVGLYLGLRVGEVSGLMWSDIDWGQHTLTVNRTVQRSAQADGRTKVVVGTPKSSASFRTIPVPDFLMKLFSTCFKKAGRQSAYLFGQGDHSVEPRMLQRRLATLMKRLGLEGVHFHTLRHTFATRLLEMGVDIKTVSVLLGHSSARITLDFYAHSTLEQRRRAMERLEACVA